MLHRKLIFMGQEVHAFEWHPSKNTSQIVKSQIGKRQPIQSFRHPWFEERGRRIAMRVNLGFFNMDDPTYIHMGLLARDGGTLEGVPNNGYEMILTRDGTLHVEQLRMLGIKGIEKFDWSWATSLSYPLVRGGKKFLDPMVQGFNRTSKTERTAFGQKADKTLVAVVARGMDADMTADLMIHLGCVTAIMGDGGGSTQMMIEDKHIVQSSRALGTALVVLAKEGEEVQFVDETAKKEEKPLLIIDPGHGGNDPGAIGNGIVEKEYTLKISLYQFERFKQLGVPVALTRDSDITLDSTPRTNLVKSSGAKYCISNHINAAGSASARGVETIHSIFSNGQLATALFRSIVDEGVPARRVFCRQGANGRDYYYMHRETGAVETVIVEYGFATNTEDAKLIKENWQRYAEAVVRGFCQFIGHPYTPPNKEEPKTQPGPLPAIQRSIEVQVNGQTVGEGYLINNRTYVPILTVGNIFGAEVQGLGDRVNIKKEMK